MSRKVEQSLKEIKRECWDRPNSEFQTIVQKTSLLAVPDGSGRPQECQVTSKSTINPSQTPMSRKVETDVNEPMSRKQEQGLKEFSRGNDVKLSGAELKD